MDLQDCSEPNDVRDNSVPWQQCPHCLTTYVRSEDAEQCGLVRPGMANTWAEFSYRYRFMLFIAVLAWLDVVGAVTVVRWIL